MSERSVSTRLAAVSVSLLVMMSLASCGSSTETTTETTTSTSTETTSTETTSTETTSTETTTTETGDGEPSTTNTVILGAVFHGDATIDFGIVAIGATRSKMIEIVNNDVARTITSLGLAGDNASDFTIVSNGCQPPTELAPFAACTLEVEYAPAATGTRVATLSLGLDPMLAGEVQVPLRGGQRRKIPTPSPPPITDTGRVLPTG